MAFQERKEYDKMHLVRKHGACFRNRKELSFHGAYVMRSSKIQLERRSDSKFCRPLIPRFWPL